MKNILEYNIIISINIERGKVYMKKLETTVPSPSVRMIERSRLKELVYQKLNDSGDPSNIKPTLVTALDAIVELRLDSRVMATNKDGKEVLLTLMGSHVYTWTNSELIEAVRDCFSEKELYSNVENRNNREYIVELDENDKRILSTN